MNYMTFFRDAYIPKNNLEKAQIDFLKTRDRILIESKVELGRVMTDILLNLKQINLDNPRCKPFEPVWRENGHFLGSDYDDYYLEGIRVVIFDIYAIKSDLESKQIYPENLAPIYQRCL